MKPKEIIQEALIQSQIRAKAFIDSQTIKQCHSRMVSVRLMCIRHINELEYFNQIRNEIKQSTEKDASLLRYVTLGEDDSPDIYLTANGLFVFSDILFKYFEREEIVNFHKYISTLNGLGKNKHELKSQFKIMRSMDLWNMLTISKNIGDNNHNKLEESVAELIKCELREREECERCTLKCSLRK